MSSWESYNFATHWLSSYTNLLRVELFKQTLPLALRLCLLQLNFPLVSLFHWEQSAAVLLCRLLDSYVRHVGQYPTETAQRKQPSITSMWLSVGSTVWWQKPKPGHERALCSNIYNEVLHLQTLLLTAGLCNGFASFHETIVRQILRHVKTLVFICFIVRLKSYHL